MFQGNPWSQCPDNIGRHLTDAEIAQIAAFRCAHFEGAGQHPNFEAIVRLSTHFGHCRGLTPNCFDRLLAAQRELTEAKGGDADE